LTGCKPANFPSSTNLNHSVDQGEPLSNPEVYGRLVGRLLYLNITRPNISYSVQNLSEFVSQPRQPHLQAALHLVKYLKGTFNAGIFFIQPILILTSQHILMRIGDDVSLVGGFLLAFISSLVAA